MTATRATITKIADLPRHTFLASRFWQKVARTEDENACWEWQAQKHRNGYGLFSVGPRMLRKRKFAHRVAYLLSHGSIDEDLYVCHTCDNPPCCNPKHLYQGTQLDNMADLKTRGRWRCAARDGENNGNAKLTVAIVRDIRARCPAERPIDLAREYGVNRSVINSIVRRATWKKV